MRSATTRGPGLPSRFHDLALVIALLVAAAAPVRIAPKLDAPYTLTVHEERRYSGVVHRFASERRIVFHREGDGLIADMTLVRLERDVTGVATRRFDAGAGALRGKVVRLHLAADGTVTAIDDQAALWLATMSGLAAMPGGPASASAAAALAHDPAALLAAIPEPQQRRMLASPLLSVLAADEAALPPGSRAVTLPGRSLPGGQSMTGTQQVEQQPDRRLRITVHADDGAMRVDRERLVDPATGLVLRTDETVTVGAGPDTETIHETATLEVTVR